MSTCVIKDIYNIPFESAKSLVSTGAAKMDDFWVFVGYAGWGPKQLELELKRQSWYLAAADSAVVLNELLTQASDPLSLPRVDSATQLLLPGGDGLATWDRLARAIGKDEAATSG